MLNIILAFVTGLTTGGLSCLAVQGGLLASSLANQIEKDVQAHAGQAGSKKKGAPVKAKASRSQMALPIAAFLAAKLVAYTILGFILGLLGSMFQLSAGARAVLQIAIGIFMVGSALRMLNVHPIFRYFAFEPPAFLRRRIRRAAADGSTSLTTPIFLGAMTVLIPCGITQAMMAAALGTSNPLEGAALMFAFTLGASPVFFAVAYFATQLGARLERRFMAFVAVVVLVLGLFSIDTGLTLAGSPVSMTRVFNEMTSKPVEAKAGGDLEFFSPTMAGPAAPTETVGNPAAAGDEVVTVQVMNYGYEPQVVHAKAGVPVKLRLVSQDVYSCSLAFIIPSLGVEQYLEPTGEAWIDIPAQPKGTDIPFSCSMGMFTGTIVFDL